MKEILSLGGPYYREKSHGGEKPGFLVYEVLVLCCDAHSSWRKTDEQMYLGIWSDQEL